MISKISFAAFSSELRGIQTTDADTPPDYLETRAAVLTKLGLAVGGLGKAVAGVGQKVMNSGAGRFVAQHSEPLTHGAELAGLGILAAPSVMHAAGGHPSEKMKTRTELAGLGTLAAPSAISMGKHLLTRH